MSKKLFIQYIIKGQLKRLGIADGVYPDLVFPTISPLVNSEIVHVLYPLKILDKTYDLRIRNIVTSNLSKAIFK